ncbi:MAG: hypothetical protein JNK29_11665 [Anaerolineales bacterium]|nr:hypothetical protein [Anaerolineales bacterium]
MDMGMLWKDDHPHRTLAQKVARGVEAFRLRYQEHPTVCFVHPSMLPTGSGGGLILPAGLRVLATRKVPAHHFWLGVNAAVLAPAAESDRRVEPALYQEARL